MPHSGQGESRYKREGMTRKTLLKLIGSMRLARDVVNQGRATLNGKRPPRSNGAGLRASGPAREHRVHHGQARVRLNRRVRGALGGGVGPDIV